MIAAKLSSRTVSRALESLPPKLEKRTNIKRPPNAANMSLEQINLHFTMGGLRGDT